MAEDLRHFTASVLEHWGAAVETKGETVEALLPGDLAARLQMREHVHLRFTPQEENGAGSTPSDMQLLTYGSPALEQVLGLLADQGTVAAVELHGLYLKQAAPGPEIERLFQPLNARGKLVSAGIALIPYGIFHFRYTAVSDEKTEGLVTFALNLRSLAEVPAVAYRWREVEWQEHEANDGAETATHPPNVVYKRACRLAQRHISHTLSDFHHSRERRLERDVQRLEEYYLGIAGEIRTRLQKKGLSGAEAEKEEAKAVAAERELQSKIHDLEEKYAVRVQVSFVNILYVTLPVLLATMSYQRRQAFRELPCFWNPILKDWEALACEGCGENTFAFSLCDDKQHLTCANCSHPCPTCGRRFCSACQPQGCPGCRKARQ
jgi:hypothetical protein